jgi:uncharacterized protein
MQPALYLFAKQPIPGQVKTRLQPEYSRETAAEIAALLIRETAALAAACWPGPIYLSGAPGVEHPLFCALADQYGLELIGQGEGDLGARMQRALAHGIERHGAAAILGTDVPHCPGRLLGWANAVLAGGGNVLGPAVDGGYYFIGMAQLCAPLFVDMPWGGTEVCAETLRRARARHVEFCQLAPVRDIDSAADLQLVARRYKPLRQFLPHQRLD